MIGRPFTDLTATTGVRVASRHVFKLVRGITRVTLAHHLCNSAEAGDGPGSVACAVACGTGTVASRIANRSEWRRIDAIIAYPPASS
jgi:hypothetical protein